MSQNNWYCRARACRFKTFHTTLGHTCGFEGCAHPTGHGQMEHLSQKVDDMGCHGEDWKKILFRHRDDKMPDHLKCTLSGCKYNWSHNKTSHQCKKCLQNGEHTTSKCPINDYYDSVSNWNLPQNEIVEFFQRHGEGFIEYYVGMGCILYIKKMNNEITTMFLHSDSHGQYGPHTNDLPTRDFFIIGVDNLTVEWEERISLEQMNGLVDGDVGAASINSVIKCPLCRNPTERETVKFIKGLDAKCVVCLTNNIETYFPDCEHTTVCKNCFYKLD